jgi:outer membrane immunogenic protein
MKKITLAFLALSAAVVSATAADLPRNRRGKIPAQVYSPVPLAAQSNSGGTFWQGGYIGAHLGYGTGGSFSGNNGWSVTGARGVIGGLQGGYDWQFSRFVVGAAADVSLSSISASNAAGGGHLGVNGSLRARAGFLVTDRVLVYGTAGIAAGRVKIDTVLPLANETKMLMGSTWGVGAEYAFSQNMSALLEYRYTSLGRSGYGSLANVSYDANAHTLRAGINYRF